MTVNSTHAVRPRRSFIFAPGLKPDMFQKALACGADFVMLGRPMLYAIGADGARGLSTLIDCLAAELSTTLAQIGLTDIGDVGADCLFVPAGSRKD